MRHGLIFRFITVNKVDPPGSTPNNARRSDSCHTKPTILNLLPPVGGTGGGTAPTSTEDIETDEEALMSDPPTTGTGGGGG